MIKQKIHLLKRTSFPSHSFFDHLLRGTEYYRLQNFERAAEEWGAAGWLNYETPINIRRERDRIFLGGFISEVPFLFFLYAVYANKVNGVGAIKANGISKNLIFQDGRLIRAATNRKLIFRPSPYAETRQEKIQQRLTDTHKFIFSLIDGTRNIEQLA
jgi:hypothetical protein